MPVESKRSGSPRGARSASPPTRKGPRTRSMAHKEATEEQQHSMTTADYGATGSEVHNNDGGGSPSSNESPSPVQVQRKKPRRAGVSEITEEQSPIPSPQPPPPEPQQVLTPGRESNGSENQEHVVDYYTQYIFSRLWRAMENYEVWDSNLMKAFRAGPCAVYAKAESIVRGLHSRVIGTSREVDQHPEKVTQSLLQALRPRGLYSCCARIFQRTQTSNYANARPLKRKKPEPECPAGPSTLSSDEQSSPPQFKHRFLMDPPNVIILSGPESVGLDEKMDIVE